MAAFFLTSMVQTSLMQSGAFEIYMNGNLEFSKLQTGQMPDFHAIQLIYRKYGIEIWRRGELETWTVNFELQGWKIEPRDC